MPKPTPEQWGSLTRREREILEGLAAGRSYVDLAAEHDYTPRQVRAHARVAAKKLGQPSIEAARQVWLDYLWRGHNLLWKLVDHLRYDVYHRRIK